MLGLILTGQMGPPWHTLRSWFCICPSSPQQHFPPCPKPHCPRSSSTLCALLCAFSPSGQQPPLQCSSSQTCVKLVKQLLSSTSPFLSAPGNNSCWTGCSELAYTWARWGGWEEQQLVWVGTFPPLLLVAGAVISLRKRSSSTWLNCL